MDDFLRHTVYAKDYMKQLMINRILYIHYNEHVKTTLFHITSINNWLNSIICIVLFCSLAVLDPRVGHTMDVLSPFISVLCRYDIDSSTESSVHVLMLSIQAMRGLPRLRAPGIVPCVHETCRIFLSPFICKASRHVSSFFPSVQLSQPYVATGYTSAFISPIFVEIGML